MLSFFEEHDLLVSPKVVGANLGYHPGYIGRRLRALRDAGLLDQHDNGLYELSNLGREFLAGDLPVEDVEKLDPDHDSAASQ